MKILEFLSYFIPECDAEQTINFRLVFGLSSVLCVREFLPMEGR
ncbi:hypothetical protein T05_3022 [Trichinella murrelli]|uniref:Uncharacterized protein n=1 Tax=Trichinella murrelli TaxID=144512 RepID=A0A0V0STC4_9BILA|nr:hypothetical protein T05_3022 [Trichinella murrelli]